jgi:hypothetical protein
LLLTVADMAAEPPLAPTQRPFAERFTERVPVSGRTLAGPTSVGSTQLPDGVGLLPGSMALPAALAAS